MYTRAFDLRWLPTKRAQTNDRIATNDNRLSLANVQNSAFYFIFFNIICFIRRQPRYINVQLPEIRRRKISNAYESQNIPFGIFNSFCGTWNASCANA